MSMKLGLRMLGFAAVSLLAAPTWAQNSFSINCANTSVAAGGTASCSVSLTLAAAVQVDSIDYTIQANAINTAPTVDPTTTNFTNGLTANAGRSTSYAPNFSATAAAASPEWVELSPVLTGVTTVTTGTFSFTVPASAAGGSTYTVTFGSQPPGASCCGTNQSNVATSVTVGSVTITVPTLPTIAEAFSPTTIQLGGTSTLTYTITNSGSSQLTGGTFTDTLTNIKATAGAVTGTCGAAPANLAAGTTALTFTGMTIPANGSCTVIIGVTSNSAGTQSDAASGVTTNQTAVGPAATAATLTVLSAPSISEAFSPISIASGGTSTLTYTLSNTNATALTGGTFSDTLSKMSAAGGAVGGSCLGTTPSTLTTGTTALTFTGIALSASSSCTVTLSVTSSTVGANTDAASGVTTTQTPTAGTGAASATLTVTADAAPTIAEAFSPNSIAAFGSSTLTFTLTNGNSVNLTGGSFSDSLTNMSAVGGAVGGTCNGTTPSTLSAGATALSFTGITIPASGNCTVTLSVTSSTVGAQGNAASGITTTQTALGPAASSATLTVTALATPTIAEAFNPATIPAGGTSTLTFTLANSNATALSGGTFTDTLANMSAAGGSVTGTCGASPASFNAGTTALTFTGITIPASSNCTVILTVTSSTAGAQNNAASGVTTTQTTSAGPAASIATLTVLALPTITKAFSPNFIQSGGTSTVTLTLANATTSALTGGSFSDTLTNMTAVGGAAGGTCTGANSNSFIAGAASLSFTGISIPASGSCTVTFSVTSSTAGVQSNTTSGVTTTQTTLGAPSNTANLSVLTAPTVSKAFGPATIVSGGTSVVTVTISNSNASALSGGAFTDTLTGMSAVGGAAGGTCTGANSNTLGAGSTALSFTGISIPASASCTVTFSVTSTSIGAQSNTTSGVTTTQTPTAGAASNTAGLTVNYAMPTISKAFSPATIQSGGTSQVTLTLGNTNTVALSGGAFTDTLVNMSAAAGAVGGTCTGTSPNSLSAGTTALSFSGINIPASSTCTVTFAVTSSTAGAQSNIASGITTTQTTTAGTASNTAGLTVLASPTISKAFSPISIQSGGTSTVTITLTNANASALTGGAFTDTLANMSAAGGAVSGTCVGTAPANLAASATALSFSGITIPASASCTVIFNVTSTTIGAQTNATSGVTTTQTPTAGAVSNTATLTVTYLLPTISKTFSPTAIQSGGSSTVTITLANTNTIALTGGAFTDGLVNMSAVGGAVGGTCVGTTPSTLTAGVTALSFTGITIQASGNCTVTFSVTSSTAGVQPNVASGVTTTQTPVGSASNTVSLTVFAPPTITKAFAPATIQTGAASVVTLTLANSNGSALTAAAFTDTLANMSATAGAVGGTCAGTAPAVLAAGATALSFTGITIPANGSCTVTFSVTSTTIGVQSNVASAVTTTQTPTAVTGSNLVNLTVTLIPPTISKVFNPTGVAVGGNSVVTLTLGNANTSALTGGAFTDTLVNMTAVAGAVGGTCVGTTPAALAANATALSFTGIAIPASGSCTVTFSVTSSHSGVNPNTTSGVTTTQVPTAGAVSNTANLTVAPPLSITTQSVSAGTVNVGYSQTITATGGTTPYTWSISSGALPPGLSIGASTGIISGTPSTTVGSPFTFTVKVTDANQTTATSPSYSLAIGALPLSITTGSLPAGVVNLPYTYTHITATGGVGNYSWTVTGLPPGLQTDGNGDIFGTPTSATGSPFSVVVTLTDSTGTTVKQTYSLVINVPLSVAAPNTLPAAALNNAYNNVTVTASGGLPPYTWTATGLPAGMTIGLTTGVISGTPTVATGSPYSVTVTVEDSTGKTASIVYTLTVNSPLTITVPASLPMGTVGTAYTSTTITASGGTGTYTWSATGLPTGLAISSGGVITGTPGGASAGSYTVVVTVTDSASNTATKSYPLTVNAISSVPTITGATAATEGQAFIGPNVWVSIYGTNFASTGFTDTWTNELKAAPNTLPIMLDNVTVNIGGDAAYVSFISATQINVLAPNIGLGPVQVTVTTAAGTSSAVTVTSQQDVPGFFEWPNNQPIATHLNYSDAAAPGTFAGVTTVPAAPGETILLWGSGFGLTSPTFPYGVPIPSTPTFMTSSNVSATLNGAPMTVIQNQAFLTAGAAGLFQVAVTLPTPLANGSYPLIVTINGIASPALMLTVQN